MDIQQLEKRVRDIEIRNQSVELNKAWEISKTRRVCVALLTYLLISVFFIINSTPQPFISSLVPTLGFILSTLSLEFIKKAWKKTIVK